MQQFVCLKVGCCSSCPFTKRYCSQVFNFSSLETRALPWTVIFCDKTSQVGWLEQFMKNNACYDIRANHLQFFNMYDSKSIWRSHWSFSLSRLVVFLVDHCWLVRLPQEGKKSRSPQLAIHKYANVLRYGDGRETWPLTPQKVVRVLCDVVKTLLQNTTWMELSTELVYCIVKRRFCVYTENNAFRLECANIRRIALEALTRSTGVRHVVVVAILWMNLDSARRIGCKSVPPWCCKT